MQKRRLVTLALVAAALFTLASAAAEAQGVFFITNNRGGLGTSNPQTKFHVADPTDAFVFVQNTGGSVIEKTMFQLSNFGPVRFQMSDSSSGQAWSFKTGGGNLEVFQISKVGGSVNQFSVFDNGNVIISGNVFTQGCPAGCGPDWVFEPDYDLMPLDELEAYITENKHLPRVPPAVEMETEGINMTQLQLRLLEKVEELTLYTIEQQKTIDELQGQLAALEAR